MNRARALLDAKIGQVSPEVPTVKMLRDIVKLVKEGRTSHEVASYVGLEEARTVALVGEMGTWLSQVFTRPEEEAVAAVVIPAGFDRQAQTRRDVSQSVRSIVFHDPSDKVLRRFIDRRYRVRELKVTLLTLSTVQMFAKLGRIEGLAGICDDVAFLTSLRDSLDLLERARLDALLAWDIIVSEPDDRATVTQAALQAEWSSPVELRRLLLALRTSDDDHLWRRELGLLARRVRQSPSRYRPESIASLSYGQVVMIAAAYEVVESYEKMDNGRREVRESLASDDIMSAADGMFPELGHAATKICEEQFWSQQQLTL